MESTGKFVAGTALGIVLTYVFVHTGAQPPAVLRLKDDLFAIPHLIVASSVLEDPESTLEERQRAVATTIRYDADFYRDVDDALENAFTQRVRDRITDRKLQYVRAYSTALNRATDEAKYPDLVASLKAHYGVETKEELQQHMLAREIRDDPLLHQHLRKRFPGESDLSLAARILSPGETEPAGPP